MTEAAPSPTGLLVVDKPLGLTSMTVCAAIRRRLRAGGAPKRVKVGHGGTLDPLATGVLVVLVGKATKRCAEVMAGEKEYDARVDLAHRSATDDHEGPLEAVPIDAPPTQQQIESALEPMVGRVMQAPPAFSAVKIDGKRAYALARRDAAVLPEARPVVIHAIDVACCRWPMLDLRIRSGKGVYIRSIARDLGRALGTGGCLAALRRTRVGRWHIDQATPLDDLPDAMTQADLLEPDTACPD